MDMREADRRALRLMFGPGDEPEPVASHDGTTISDLATPEEHAALEGLTDAEGLALLDTVPAYFERYKQQ